MSIPLQFPVNEPVLAFTDKQRIFKLKLFFNGSKDISQ